MWLSGSAIGLDAAMVRWVAVAVALLVAAMLSALAWRATGPRRELAVALMIGAITIVPSVNTALASLGLVLASVCAIGAAWLLARVRPPRWLRRLRAWLMRMPRARFDTGVSLAFLAIAITLSFALFDGYAVVQDSQAQIFHAEILATGRWVAPSPPSPLAFHADHVITEPAFYSQYPPGHIVALVPFVLLGAPWLAAPVLGMLGVLALGRLARTIYGERTARRAMLLALASPFVVLMSAEAMSHVTTLVLTAVALDALVRWAKDGALSHALVLGVAMGAHLLTRPVTAACITIPMAAYALAALRTHRRVGSALLAASVALALGALLLAWNQVTNGDPLTMGYVVRWGPNHTFGFHDTPWGDPHTPAVGVEHTLSNLTGWNVFLLGGPLPALALAALGALRDRARRETWLLVGIPASILVVHFFYFFQDLCFGPRYLYEASVGGLLLASRGLGALPSLLAHARLPRPHPATLAGLAWAFSLALFWPPLLREYHHGYCPRGRVVDTTMAVLERAHVPGAVLVMTDQPFEWSFYVDDPDLTERVIYAIDRGDEENMALRCAMREREAWLLRGGDFRALPRPACPPHP
jgi:hypothetical protein